MASTPPGETEQEPRAEADPPAPREAHRVEQTTATPPAAERDFATQPESGGILVRVIDDRSGLPVPRAEVAWLGWTISQLAKRVSESEDFLAEISDRTPWYRAGDDGTLRVPITENAFVLAGEHPDAEGPLRGIVRVPRGFERQKGEILLPLRHPVTLTTIVQDEYGAPQTELRVGFAGSAGEWPQFAAYARRPDPEGRCRFHNANLLLPAWFGERARICVEVLGQPVEAAIDTRFIPTEPVLLRVTAGCEVEVRVFDEKKQPIVDEPVEVYLSQPRIDGPFVSPMIGATSGGTYTFRSVPLGVELLLSGHRPGPWQGDSATIRTPSRTGGRSVEELVFDRPSWTLAGRLVDYDGAPHRETRFVGDLQYQYARHIEGSEGITEVTDEEGRFEFEMGGLYRPGGGARGYFEVRIERDDGAILFGTSADFPEDYRLGRLDIGDIVVDLPPVLAAGLVIDGSARPLAGAVVEVHVPWRDFGTGELAPPSKGVAGFMPFPIDSCQSGEDGTFELRGPANGAQVWVTARLARHLPVEPELHVAEGATDVRIVLEGAGEVRGSFLLTGARTARQLSVALLPTGTGGDWEFRGSSLTSSGVYSHPDPRYRFDPNDAGRFTFESVRPGLYDLGVIDQNGEKLLTVIDEIEVVPGELCADPRLVEIEPE